MIPKSYHKSPPERGQIAHTSPNFEFLIALPPEVDWAIATNQYSHELSRLADQAIAQAETLYELEFKGVGV